MRTMRMACSVQRLSELLVRVRRGALADRLLNATVFSRNCPQPARVMMSAHLKSVSPSRKRAAARVDLAACYRLAITSA